MIKPITTMMLLLTTAVASSSILKNETKMNDTLTAGETALAVIACSEAKGDMVRLSDAITAGLESGVTEGEIKEALSQLYAYTGFPRSLNALGVLQRVTEERKAAGKRDAEWREPTPRAEGYDALREGTRVQTQLTGRSFSYTYSPSTDYYLKAHLFGDIFSRDNLSYAQRELVTISALAGMEGVEPQLKAHVSGGRNMGLNDGKIHAIAGVLREKSGEKEGYRVAKAVAEVYGESLNEGEPVAKTWARGEANTAYAKYFIGNSYLSATTADGKGPVNVTFEPRCRNNWHIHHKGVQVLICVSGRGWYQEWGKEAIEMREGTVVAIAAEVKHWHGAAKDSWFQHLTYMTDVKEGMSNEWLEAVNDDEYDKLR